MKLRDAVIQLHDIAREIVDEAPTYSFELRRVADALDGHAKEKREREERTRHTRHTKNKLIIVTDCVGEEND